MTRPDKGNAGATGHPHRRETMQTRPVPALAALITLLFITACGPIFGAGVAVGADQIAEEEDGGDGLF